MSFAVGEFDEFENEGLQDFFLKNHLTFLESLFLNDFEFPHDLLALINFIQVLVVYQGRQLVFTILIFESQLNRMEFVDQVFEILTFGVANAKSV